VPRLRRSTLIASAAVTAAALVVGPATLASAIDDDVDSGNMAWYEVYDDEPYIEDVQSRYPNILGTGTDLVIGWTVDAFDGMISDSTIDGEDIEWSAAPGGVGWVPGGLSSFVYLGVSDDFDPAFQIGARLEIQGNYARWTFTPIAGPTGLLELTGNLGSDYDQTTIVVTPNSAVVSSDDIGQDQVLGYWVSGPDATLYVPPADAGDDDVVWTATTSGPVTAVIALQDYAPCAQQVAIDAMVGRVAALNSGFGATIEGALECATVGAAAALSTNASDPQTLPVVIDPTVDAWLADPYQLDERDPYLSDPSLVGSAFVGAPAGVTLAFDASTSSVAVSGTPTTPGVYDVTLVLWVTDADQYSFDETGNGYPLVARFQLEVTGPTLAATGDESVLPLGLLAAGLLAAGAVALGARRTLRRG